MARTVTGYSAPDAQGNVTVFYSDGTKTTESHSQAVLAGHVNPSGVTPSASPSVKPSGAAFGTTTQTGGTPPPAATASGAVTADNLTAWYQQALSSKSGGYSKIRTALVNAGLISKGTRSLQSVQNAWLGVLQGAQADGTDPYTFISNIKAQGAGLDTAGQGPTDYSQVTVWDPTKAKDYISQLTTNLLNREATPTEIADLSNELKKAQSASPSKTVYTKDKKGKTVATTTGGIDEQQFLTDLIKATPEYAAVKGSATNAALQSVMQAARANGITTLTPEQLNSYAERVRNGEKVENIASTFRKIAGVSQPQRIADLLNSGVDLADIYAPYKSAMAKTLEIDPNTIDFTDPALSSAVTGDKTMTTYEFQRALRKDPRWQYTDNARSEASDVAAQVLKDFGFMG